MRAWRRGVVAGRGGGREAYFADFERMFCAAPTMTASMSGVVPNAEMIGRSASLNMMSEKKTPPMVVPAIKAMASAIGRRRGGDDTLRWRSGGEAHP